eukprot:gene4921-3533_t
MVSTLTWQVLSPEITHHCLAAVDVPQIRAVLRKYNKDTEGALLKSQDRTPAQLSILVDLYSHLIMFAKSREMNPEKTSTLVGIMQTVHETSMAEGLTRVASYDLLRVLIVQHSVPRPPYSSAIFDVGDVQDLDEYLLSTYYRHYKMYAFAFVKVQRANVTTYLLGDAAEKPPYNLPALTAALPQGEWKRKTEERERRKEEALMEEAFKESMALEEKRQREAGLNNPQYSDGIREQLEAIRNAVSTKSMDRLDLIEQKLTAIEQKVDDMTGGKAKPGSKK